MRNPPFAFGQVRRMISSAAYGSMHYAALHNTRSPEASRSGTAEQLRWLVTLRFALAALCIGLISFSAGTMLSFVSAYFVVQPHAKFTGAAAFHLGVVVSAWMSICLMLSFLITA